MFVLDGKNASLAIRRSIPSALEVSRLGGVPFVTSRLPVTDRQNKKPVALGRVWSLLFVYAEHDRF